MKINIKYVEVLFLILILLLYLGVGLSYIKLPGLYHEEGLLVNVTVEIMETLKSSSIADAIKNKLLPMSISARSGALEAYILLPFFYIFGINPMALRLEPLISGIFTIVLTYWFTKELFNNRKAAFLATILLTINPGFIISIKTGTNSTSLIQAFSLAIFLCFLRWYRKENNFYFYLGMFLLGLGINIRVWFLWVVAAVCVNALFFFKDIKRIVLADRRGLLKCVVIGGGAFIVGATLFFYNNIYLYFLKLTPAFSDFISNNPAYLSKNYGISSVSQNYWHNLSYVFNEFNILINGSCFGQQQLDISLNVSKLYPLVFWISFVVLLSLSMVRKLGSKKGTMFLLIIFSVIFAQMPVFIFRRPTTETHLPILYPFPQIIISMAVFICASYLKKVKAIPALIISLILILGVENLFVMQRYFYFLKKSGGTGYYSDAVYRLSDYLMEKKCFAPVILSYGLHWQLPITSGWAICPVAHQFIHSTYKSGNDGFIGILKEKCKDNGNMYIAYTREYDYGVPNGLEILRLVAKEMNKNVIEEKRFYQRDGKQIYSVYKIS